MKVNNIDTSAYGITLLDREISTSEIITYQDWLKKSLAPLKPVQEVRFKKVWCEYLLEARNDNEALAKESDFINLSKEAVLKFDDIDFYYRGTLESNDKERIIEGNFLLRLTWKCEYSYKPEIADTANRVASKTINVPGNTETPAIVEITPSVDIIDIVVTGLGETFTLSNLKAGQKVIINGEDDTVLQGASNKFPDFDGWEFPKLKPGNNNITFSKTNCDITIKYKPRWI